MKRLFTLCLSVLFASVSFAQITISKWSFEGVTTTNTGTTPTFSVGSAVADDGARITGSLCTGFHAAAATAWSNPAGNGSPKSLSSNTWAVGDYYQFQTSTTGCSGISLSWDQTGSGTGPSMFKVQYSTDGTNFTDGQSYTVPVVVAITAIAWNNATANPASTVTSDLSAVTALNNQANIYIRLVCNGTTSIGGGTVGTGGTGRIDNFTIAGSVVAPLNIKSFSASLINNKASLAWSTSNEINVNGFSIERSADGSNFAEAGFVKANNAASNQYSFNDAVTIIGATYFRLKMVDKDGSFKYSQTVVLNTKKSIKLDVYPNPVTNTITLSHTKADNTASIKIVTVEGKTIATYNVQLGATQTSIDATKLTRGNYLVVFENEGAKSTSQFIKQ